MGRFRDQTDVAVAVSAGFAAVSAFGVGAAVFVAGWIRSKPPEIAHLIVRADQSIILIFEKHPNLK